MATATTAAPDRQQERTTRRTRTGIDRAYYWMVVPAFVLFFIFHTIPVLQGIFYSFTNSIGFGEWEFVGLINYQAMLTDPAIWQSYLFTFGFAFVP